MPPLADLHVDHQALADLADAAVDTVKKSDLITPLSDGLETVLKRLQDGLQTLHVPYSYGFSIILLTLIVKIVTFPLTKKQVGREQLVDHARGTSCIPMDTTWIPTFIAAQISTMGSHHSLLWLPVMSEHLPHGHMAHVRC